MPSIGNPLSGLNLNRNLTKEELIRAVRFMVAAEYEAVEMYGKVHDATDDPKIKKAIQSIIDEEKIHAGEFLEMLSYLDPEEDKFYNKGRKETKELLKEENFMSAKKTAASRIINAYFELEAGYGSNVEEAMRGRGRRLLVEPKSAPRPTGEAKSTGSFAKEGEPVWVMNDEGKWLQIAWSTQLKEEVKKSSGSIVKTAQKISLSTGVNIYSLPGVSKGSYIGIIEGAGLKKMTKVILR